jgi:hypothetical protein
MPLRKWNLDLRTVVRGDSLGLRQAEAVAAIGTGGVRLIETLEDVWQGFRVNATAGVRDGEAMVVQNNGDMATAGSVLDRVVQ